MGPIHVRQFMQIFGELGRIYLAPRDKKAIKKNTHRYAVDDYSGEFETSKMNFENQAFCFGIKMD